MHFGLVPGCWQSAMFLIFQLFLKITNLLDKKNGDQEERKNKGTKMPKQKLKKKKESLETNTLGSAEQKKQQKIGIERDALLVWGTPLNSYRGEE